jgi:hypothetical protein
MLRAIRNNDRIKQELRRVNRGAAQKMSGANQTWAGCIGKQQSKFAGISLLASLDGRPAAEVAFSAKICPEIRCQLLQPLS